MVNARRRVRKRRAMFDGSLQKDEKKVEYLELIYDLIFVYIIGRNNSLLHQVENGFVSGEAFLSYVLYTLAVIQIWNYSTFYINRYGRNGTRDHVFLFINMYLLYHVAEGTGSKQQECFYRYNVAWALILINIGVQYIIEMKDHRDAPWEISQIKRTAAILFIQAALIAAHMAVYRITGVSSAWAPIAFGIAAAALSGRVNDLVAVEFAHLTERAMLYVVFTFGEMIIAIASYFTGETSPRGIYFSLMAFLAVVGLLLAYGTLYNRIIDRERSTNGTAYMLLHVFIVFALNNITTALEFMREAEVSLMPKTVFITASIILYYAMLFLILQCAKKSEASMKRFRVLLPAAVVFAALMLLLRSAMFANIAVTVIFIYGVYALIYRYGVKTEQPG